MRALTDLSVTLVCESFSRKASGGSVARHLAKCLVEWGARVCVFCLRPLPSGESGVPGVSARFAPAPGFVDSTLHHLLRGPQVAAFRDCLREFLPDVVHVASLDYIKPRYLVEEAHALGIRIVLQPWVHYVYCEQGYGFRDGMECSLCADGSFGEAVKNGCCASTAKGLLHAVSRARLRRSALKADVVYCTSTQLSATMARYGFDASARIMGPLAFDPLRLPQGTSADGQEFVFYGQARDFKGFNVLRDVVDRCPGARFGIFPFGATAAQVRAARLDDLPAGVALDATLRWDGGLSARIAGARGVVLPTLWPTTPEYALLEALGLGKPVVAFRIGAHQDLLQHGVSAMLAPPGDLDAFAEAIRQLDADAALRARLSRGAREAFAAATSPERLRSALLEAYGVGPEAGP